MPANSPNATLVAKRNKGKFTERRRKRRVERKAKQKAAAENASRINMAKPRTLEYYKEKKERRALLKEWGF